MALNFMFPSISFAEQVEITQISPRNNISRYAQLTSALFSWNGNEVEFKHEENQQVCARENASAQEKIICN